MSNKNPKVRIKTKTRYDIVINGKEFKDCTLQSKWRGMACFRCKEGEIIIDGFDYNNLVEKLLSETFDIEHQDQLSVVKASPDIVYKITEAENE